MRKRLHQVLGFSVEINIRLRYLTSFPICDLHAFSVMRLLLLLILWLVATGVQATAQPQVPTVSGPGVLQSGGILLSEGWKMRQGDSLIWATPSFDDALWAYSASLLELDDDFQEDLTGTSWFRLRLQVTPEMAGIPVAILTEYVAGAAEVYLNGRLLYTLGRAPHLSDDRGSDVTHRPFVFTFPEAGEQLLAVRYMVEDPLYYSANGFRPGFSLKLVDSNTAVDDALRMLRTDSFFRYFTTGVLLAFALLHALLYAYHTKLRENLYYAVFALCLAAVNFLTMQYAYAPVAAGMVAASKLMYILVFLTGAAILRFAYALYYARPPVFFWIYMAAGLIISLLFIMNTRFWVFTARGFDILYMALLVVSFLEVFRVIIFAWITKKDGARIIAIGLSIFMCCFAGVAASWFGPSEATLARTVSAAGTFVLLAAMSVYVSWSVGRTQKRLETKLWEIQHLSARSLQQERLSKTQEIEKKLLEADNNRKTKELEDARSLQLSMLPQSIPQIETLDIAVHMSTATEVGGDYYDFNKNKDGVLTIAVGDATGHGVKAGILVATAKSYFLSLADHEDNLTLLRKMSEGIRNLKLRMLYMGLTLFRYHQDEFTLVAAGMPPAVLYRSAGKVTEQLVLKGLPLGSRCDFPYNEIRGKMHAGDVLLLMSDGLIELFSPENTMLGYTPIEQVLQNVSHLPAETVIKALVELAEQWRNDAPQRDDMTLVVVKRK